MPKKENYWYVLVITDEGPVFVTKVEHSSKYAHYNKLERPLELGMNFAKDIAFGLTCNFHTAYPVCAPIELTCQPYRYEDYHLEWKENEESENEDE